MKIYQQTIKVKAKHRGYHLITNEVLAQLTELKSFQKGLAHFLIQHTSAGLTINENADYTVRKDFESFINRLIPDNPALYSHIDEGPDDMTSHLKSSIIGSTITIPVTNGTLNLGTWQGIYLCEFRDIPRTRTIVVTIIGE